MKTKFVLFIALLLFILTGGMGCDNESIYYEGKVISLNSGTGCFDIIEISKSIPHGLAVNSTVSFNSNLYNGQLKVGDIVCFKVIKYEDWSPQVILAMCTAPQYVGQLEFYIK